MESANDPKKFSILGNYDNKIFWPVAILYGCIIAYAIIDPSGAGATFSSIQRFIIAHFSWLILLTGASAIFFSVWMACSSRFATVKLGAADEKPEFSFFAWVAMLFCAALGTGFVIFGAAEPLYHLFTAPTVMDAGSAGAVRGVPEAIRLSVGAYSAGRCSPSVDGLSGMRPIAIINLSVLPPGSTAFLASAATIPWSARLWTYSPPSALSAAYP